MAGGMKTPRQIADSMYNTHDLTDLSDFNISLNSALHIAKNGVELNDFGAYDIGYTINEYLMYLDRINKVTHETPTH